MRHPEITPSQHDQSLAYERAVCAARRDPTMRDFVAQAFLQEDDLEAYRSFRASEHWARVQWLLRRHGIDQPARLVDFGGGRGLLAAALAADGHDVVLCEINPSEVCGTGAARRLRDVTRVDFAIEERGIEAIVAARPADAIVCRAVLHHIEPLGPTLETLRAALRPGGVFVASDEPTVRHAPEAEVVRATHPFTPFGVDETAHTIAGYVDALRSAGLTHIRVRQPTPWGVYRHARHPSRALPVVATGYLRLRVRTVLQRRPGDVRTFSAIAPNASSLT